MVKIAKIWVKENFGSTFFGHYKNLDQQKIRAKVIFSVKAFGPIQKFGSTKN